MIIFKIRKKEIRKLFSITLLSIESILPFSLFQYRHKRNNLQIQSIFLKQYYKIVYIIYFVLSLSVHRKIKHFQKYSYFPKVTSSLYSISSQKKQLPYQLKMSTKTTRSRYITLLYRQKLFSHQMITFPKKTFETSTYFPKLRSPIYKIFRRIILTRRQKLRIIFIRYRKRNNINSISIRYKGDLITLHHIIISNFSLI